jgi:hypothetical protein
MPANSLVFFVKIEPGTDVRQFAAGPAAIALTPVVFGNG